MDKLGGPAVEKAYNYLLWLIPVLEKLPRTQRFLIGDRIQSAAIDVVELLTDAIYTRDRKGLLRTAQLRIERQRILMRALCDLRFLDLSRYEFSARELDEIGRMTGGWIKAHMARQKEKTNAKTP